MNLPVHRFHPAPGREDDYAFDDQHGWSDMLDREIAVNGPDENEYLVQMTRETIEDLWCAESTDAPLEIAGDVMRKAEVECNR